MWHAKVLNDYKHVLILGFNLWLLLQLVLEGVRARQQQNAVLMDNRKMEREIQQGHHSLNFYNMKAARIEDQVLLILL